VQHFGDAAHTGAADSHKVNVFKFFEHL
jgi:hypothetical protein